MSPNPLTRENVMTYSTWVIIHAALGWRLVTFHIVIHFLSFKNKHDPMTKAGSFLWDRLAGILTIPKYLHLPKKNAIKPAILGHS